MQYTRGKSPKSFLYRFTWVGALLLALGLLFLGVAVATQFIATSPEDLTVYHNGVRQPTTEASLQNFRLTFLLAFGLIGLGLAIAGSIVLVRGVSRRRLERRLEQNGHALTAEVVQHMVSSVSVNHRRLMYLQCACTGPDGVTYLFKSGLLRMDPVPYLPDNKVAVYYDPDNMRRYFVDIDGSVGLGSQVVEL